MKKLSLIVAAVMLATGLSFAQVHVGGRVAGTMSTFKGDDSDDAPWGVGFNAGVAAKYNVNEMIAVVPEVGIDFRRIADDEATASFWVLNIPVLARISPVANLYVEAGPTIGFILSNDVEYDEPSFDDADFGGYNLSDYGIDLDDMLDDAGSSGAGEDANTFEFGLAFGLGYSVLPNLDVNFRFAIGLTNLYEDVKTEDYTFESDLQNMQLSIGATYWFN
ncbi:MAG: PorT family protein [Fibrobacter sp.]|nr:PorT family protein [Fibrobacter sp.]